MVMLHPTHFQRVISELLDLTAIILVGALGLDESEGHMFQFYCL